MADGPVIDKDEEFEKRFPLHALEYHWDRFDPHLLCYDTPASEVTELDLDDIRFSVSDVRQCIGRGEGDEYIRCGKHSPVDRFSQCPECAEESFIPFQECIFEPKCDGEICDMEFCKREHVLYIAFYDTRMKIGMSSSRRIEQRLIEQGADAFSIIGKYPTRKRAREAEKDISSRLRIPQAHRQEVLLRNLSRQLDVGGIEGRHEALALTLGEAYGLTPEPIEWLEGYPIDLPLRGTPELLRTAGSHRGERVGIKGKWLVFESDGLKALNLADMPARFLARNVA
ncbi:MAG: DUF2797 domain-containing protein [Thermoplasmata archaeon]|nr:DUF2797 domain-containing protein [Thermoplasmata archaeon]